jgi:hypothetical protein
MIPKEVLLNSREIYFVKLYMLSKGGNKLLMKHASPADSTLCNIRLIKLILM